MAILIYIVDTQVSLDLNDLFLPSVQTAYSPIQYEINFQPIGASGARSEHIAEIWSLKRTGDAVGPPTSCQQLRGCIISYKMEHKITLSSV